MMSLFEFIMMVMILVIMMVVSVKWPKGMMMIVLLELGSMMVLSLIYAQCNGLSTLLIMFFVFFVGEALILLSALFSLIQLVGLSFSSLFLF